MSLAVNVASPSDQEKSILEQQPGVTIRRTFYWHEVSYKGWAYYDGFVDWATTHQIQILGVLGYAESPQTTDEIYIPPDADRFAAFCAEAALRYPQVKAWEVWNEENLQVFWRKPWAGPNAADYVTMLQKSYTAIKAVNPNATVVLGGLSPFPFIGVPATDFLQQIYDAGGKGYFDVIGYHPYPVHNQDAPDVFLEKMIWDLRRVVDGNRDNTPFWITEMGWYTGSTATAVSEAQQRDKFAASKRILSQIPFVQMLFWFTLRDVSADGSCEFSYGLFHFDGTPKAASIAAGFTTRCNKRTAVSQTETGCHGH